MKKAVVGTMQTAPQAEMLVDRLQLLGFAPDDISVLVPGEAQDVASENGAAAGAATGGIAGALVGFGIPEYEAKIYEGKVRGGEVLVAVHVDSLESRHEAEAVFKASGAGRLSAVVEALSSKRALRDQRR
jgi:outer membrane lipoprotein SlyB